MCFPIFRHGVIAEEDLNLFSFVDDPREALKRLQDSVLLESAAEAPQRPAFAKSRHPKRDIEREE